MRKMVISAAAMCASALLFAGSAAADGNELLVYTAADDGKLHAALSGAFNKLYPDIKVKQVILSTGPITEKTIAERENPQADAIYGVNSFALEQLKNAGVIEPYSPQGTKIPSQFMDPDGFFTHHWLTLMVMAVNTQLMEQKGKVIPASWEALANPTYKDLITIAAPTKSGTGLTIFTTLKDAYGWDFIDKLHKNIFQYNSSGSAAGRQAGAGETAIGLTYDTAVINQVNAGLPVKLAFFDMTPNVKEGGALVLGAPNAENAKKWLDFMASPEGAAAYAPFVGAATTPGYGKIDLKDVNLWEYKAPVDAAAFKR
ncbi:MAG: extracellular solute-binding protein, partial [Rhodospirillales bacterium]|nr:extracellular solute-binding protein [Rhodospirillales bacterium]